MSEATEQPWYFARSGKQQGPVPESALRQMLATGQLSAADLVWREGLPQWAPAASVPGLMPAAGGLGVAPPPPPMPGYPP
jgi:hypothetical protein